MKPSTFLLLPFAAIASAQLNALPRQHDNNKAVVARQPAPGMHLMRAATGAGKGNATASATGAGGAAKATGSPKTTGGSSGAGGAKATGAGGAATTKSSTSSATKGGATATTTSAANGTVTTSGADGPVRFDALGSGLVTVAGVALGLAVLM